MLPAPLCFNQVRLNLMLLIGLTGGIAAGKTTVANLWVTLGAIEIDADVVAREVVAPGTVGAKAIEDSFGVQFFDSGTLNRKKMAELVFTDKTAKSKLEQIVHPLVRQKVLETLEKLPADAVVIYSVPLLVEAAVALPFDVIVTVEAPEDVRIQRLISDRGYSAEEAKARIANQASPIQRAQVADYILNSNQTLDEFKSDALALWNKITGK